VPSTQDNPRKQCEQAIIGAIMLDSDKALNVLVRFGCEAGWFEDKSSAAVYDYALSLFRQGRQCDQIIASSGLTPEGHTDLLTHLESCVDSLDTIAHLEYHAEQLRGYRLIQAGTDNAERAASLLLQSDPLDAVDVISRIQDSWIELCAPADEGRPLAEIGAELIEEWRTDKAFENRITWPMAKLNEIIGPLEDELVFLVAKESVGKTAFAIQLIVNAAHGHKTASFASLESSKKRILPRFIGHVGQINTLGMKYGKGTQEDFNAAMDAVSKIREMPLRVIDTPSTIDQLYAWAKGEKAAGSKLVVIDNMRHIRPSRKYNSPIEQMRDFSIRLKHIRDDVRLPVVVLHHTNDSGDVSWAKDIRRDADILLFLSEDEANSTKPTSENGYVGRTIVDCDVDKNRDGRAHIIIKTEFRKEVQTFQEWEDWR